MNRILTTFVLAFVLLSGCEVQSTLNDDPDDVLYFEPIAIGQTGAIRDTLETVLMDAEAFASALEMVSPLGDIPDVDFNQSMVGIIAIPTNSGGHVVEVQSIEKRGTEIQIQYLFSIPGDDCITVQALSLPFQIVSIRKSEGTVRFIREEDSYSCGL